MTPPEMRIAEDGADGAASCAKPLEDKLNKPTSIPADINRRIGIEVLLCTA